MSRQQNPKTIIVSGVATITAFSVWKWTTSSVIFQNMFGGDALQQFIAMMFLSITIAFVVGAMIFALLSAIE